MDESKPINDTETSSENSSSELQPQESQPTQVMPTNTTDATQTIPQNPVETATSTDPTQTQHTEPVTAAPQQTYAQGAPTPGQPYPQNPTQAQYGAPVTGQPYPQPYPQAVPTGKATGALICGILAILFCAIPIIGIVLGIVAIVLAGGYIKSGGTSGTAKGGRICGIIGIVFSVITIVVTTILIIIAINTPQGYYYESFSSTPYNSTLDQNSSSAANTYGSSSTDTEESKAVEAVATTELDRLATADPTLVAQIVSMVDSSMMNDYDVQFSEFGIDTKDYVTAMLQGFSYKDTYVALASSSNTANFACEIKIRDILDVMDLFYDMAEETAEGTSPTAAGQEFMQELQELDLDSTYFNITLTSNGGSWTIDQESWDDELTYMFCL